MKFLIPLLILTSCSGIKSLKHSKGDVRFKVSQKHYKKPEFFTPEENILRVYKSYENKRVPASINTQSDKLSNRQIYFLSLYNQHKRFGEYLNKETQKNFCPSFHQVLLENEDANYTSFFMTQKPGLEKNMAYKGSHLALFPVLALPYSKEKDLFTALEETDWSDTRFALNKSLSKHFEVLDAEVEQLCDKGVSPGYYIYENIVTYFKKKNNFNNAKDALEALAKVPAIANMLILDNLSSSKESSLSSYDYLVLERSNSTWLKGLVSKLHDERRVFLAKMIKGKTKRTVLSLNR